MDRQDSALAGHGSLQNRAQDRTRAGVASSRAGAVSAKNGNVVGKMQMRHPGVCHDRGKRVGDSDTLVQRSGRQEAFAQVRRFVPLFEP